MRLRRGGEGEGRRERDRQTDRQTDRERRTYLEHKARAVQILLDGAANGTLACLVHFPSNAKGKDAVLDNLLGEDSRLAGSHVHRVHLASLNELLESVAHDVRAALVDDLVAAEAEKDGAVGR